MSKSLDEKYEIEFESLVAELLSLLDYDASIMVDVEESEGKHYFKVHLKGKELGQLIGYHGKTMNDLQSILRVMLHRVVPDEVEVGLLLDINDYMDERSNHLQKVAADAVTKVQAEMTPVELAPMTPADRRIVHMHLQDHADIETESMGEGRERRVVVKPKSIRD